MTINGKVAFVIGVAQRSGRRSALGKAYDGAEPCREPGQAAVSGRGTSGALWSAGIGQV
jgi:hypothetical protein